MKGQPRGVGAVRLGVELAPDVLVDGLKRYRRIAKQDLLSISLSTHPEAAQIHAEARREVYAELAERAQTLSSDAVILHALELYTALPFVSGCAPLEQPFIQGREQALENFFVMVGLEPKMRREARSKRKRLETRGQA
jgi:uncharacterized protein YbjQ (UPF0145 family)